MKKSASKKTLIASAAALSLSALLFAGTTYAWFTDSASSAVSTIKSGNLDVGLQVYDSVNKTWVDVVPDELNEDGTVKTAGTDILKTANGTLGLWEPGHTEVVYLKVTNKGSLALNYQISVNNQGETKGKNVSDNEFALSDYLKYGLISGDKLVTYTSRAEAQKAAADNAKSIDSFSDTELLTAATADTTDGSEQYVALVIYMPEDVDNIANYKTGTAAPTINLGVSVNATQAPVENDSFGIDYDGTAWLDEWAKDNNDGTYSYDGNLYVVYDDAAIPVTITDTDMKIVTSTVDGQNYILYLGNTIPVTETGLTQVYQDNESPNVFYVYGGVTDLSTIAAIGKLAPEGTVPVYKTISQTSFIG
jgi:predicted ribosomally synthesized peptide with SipW-like signal peptide